MTKDEIVKTDYSQVELKVVATITTYKRANELFKRIISLPDYMCRSTYACLYGIMMSKFSDSDLDNLERQLKTSEEIVNKKEVI